MANAQMIGNSFTTAGVFPSDQNCPTLRANGDYSNP